ncbi:hypothetical protein BH23GEM5_BH23GEM5_28240 [soil metagenome]
MGMDLVRDRLEWSAHQPGRNRDYSWVIPHASVQKTAYTWPDCWSRANLRSFGRRGIEEPSGW